MRLIQGDCLEEMETIEAGSVDMVMTDPPYGTIKNAAIWRDKTKTEWDTTIEHRPMLNCINRHLEHGCYW